MRLQNIRPLSRKRIVMRGHLSAGLMLVTLISAVSADSAAQDKSKAARRSRATVQPNTLTSAEKAAGWKLLFDGKTWNGWRGFRRERVPVEGWMIEQGNIRHVAGQGEQSQQGGDIITIGEYDNLELQIDWQISPSGNSGVKYLVAEEMVKSGYSGLGFEMQVLDDDRHPDAKMGKGGNRTASALYDLIAPKNKVLQPVGEWNQARLIIRGNLVEHWLNGTKVVEYELGSPQLKSLIAESKFKNIPGFGDVRKGHILLQDHGNEVWFRNIKLRELPAVK